MNREDGRKGVDPQHGLENLRGSIFLFIDANIINMSIDGASIETPKSLSLNQEYAIKIIHHEKIIEIKGKIIWCALNRYVKNEQGDVIPIYRAGLVFIDTLTERARYLLQFIHENRVEKMEKRLLERFSIMSQKSSVKIGYTQAFTIKTIDHSGMSIVLDVSVEPGAFYPMDIQFDTNTYHFKGRVTHVNQDRGESKKYFLDIDFLEMKEDEKEFLSSYISNLSR